MARRSPRMWTVLASILVATLALAVGALPAAATPTAPAEWSQPLPGHDPAGPIPEPDPADSYQFENADHLLVYANEDPPTQQVYDNVATAEGGPLKQWFLYPRASLFAMLAYWRQVKLPKLGTLPPDQLKAEWQMFVRNHVRNIDNQYRGNGFADWSAKKLGIHGSPDYTFDKSVGTSIRPDAYPKLANLLRAYEMKDAMEIKGQSQDQLDGYVKLVDRDGKQIVYLFRRMPEPATLEKIKKANLETAINKARIAAGLEPVPAIVARILPAFAQAKPPAGENLSVWTPTATATPPAAGAAKNNGPPPTKPSGGVLAASGGGQVPVVGGLDALLNATSESPQELAGAKALAEDYAKQFADQPGAEDIGSDLDLGGVDFSTLQLRYLSDNYLGGPGLRYAFSAQPGPVDQPSYGGRAAAYLSSDAFFVWLALPTSAFTVNLNPDEPNRIIEDRFGRTDAGRVLLEADLQMKKSVAKFIHPDTPLGKQFWKGLQGDGSCLTMRQWIVPGPASVREDNGELYILDARLDVKMESDYIQAKGVGSGGCKTGSKAEETANEQLYRTLVLPKVIEAVNTAPEYADLRRVYVSRIAAQWYRERSATKKTAYAAMVDSGDASAWPSRTPWTPREVFDRYVRSYTDGEFKVTHETTQGNTVLTETFVYGGVDLTRIPRAKISGGAFARDHADLPGTVARSVNATAGAADGKLVWLGGMTTPRPLPEIARGVPSPTAKPAFWILLLLPPAAWFAAGGLLLARRRSRRTT